MQKSILMLVILGFSLSGAFGQKVYEDEWKEVEAFVRKGLPQSALAIVDNIYLQSKSEINAPQFLKAALYQIKLRSDYQEDFMESSISQINKELESSSAPISQILHSIQAELCWRYYQNNRYKFMDRTSVVNPDPADIKTWDIKTLVDEVAENYLASLEQAIQLQQIRLEQFDPILETEKDSKKYRPTLYDFLAHRAIDYFRNDEPAVTRPATVFLIDQETFYAPAKEFATLLPATPDEKDFKYLSLSLFRQLIAFHLNDTEPAALIDVDLARIKFVNENSVLANDHELYLKALKSLQNNYPDDLHSADVAYEIALAYYSSGKEYDPVRNDTNRWDIKSAREICDLTVNKYPGSSGARNCTLLLRDINDPALTFTINYANLPDQPFLASLSFRNLKTVWFRIVSIKPEEDRSMRQKEQGESAVSKYRLLTPVKQWTLDIPDEGDFQAHTTEISIPALSKGYYVILASDNADFSADNNVVAYTAFWVSHISYITRNDRQDGSMDVYVLDRDRGTPLQGVQAMAYAREYNYQSRSYNNKLIATYISDKSGYFSVPAQSDLSKSFYLEFSLGDDLFFTENYFYLYPSRQDEKTRVTTYFFTDRSIYRPGQTVYFKGIVLEKSGETSLIKTDFTTVVTFYDANNQKVTELAMTTNGYGSFNGTFIIPSGGLTGMMSIRNETGSVTFSVEEYKRPRFSVETDPLEGSYKLNETVKVTGKAMNYTGTPVDQAGVRYRIVRSARFPVWRSWWKWFPTVTETEITSGTAVTDAEGTFSFSFKAVPDLQVDNKLQPVFNYKVYIDVTDMTGEVQSAEESLSVGYQSMLLDMEIPDKVDLSEDKSFKLTVTNLDRQPIEAQGKITLYPLDAPMRLTRERAWSQPDIFTMSREEFLKEFPNDLYDNENDPDTWKKKDLLIEKSFNSAHDSVFSLDAVKNLAEGEYLLVMEAMDAFGDKVEVKKYFTAFNPYQKQMPAGKPFWYTILNKKGEPGDTASILVGTAEKNIILLYEVENDGKIVSSQWLSLSQEKTRIDIIIQDEFRGNFFINMAFIKGNRSYQLNEMISVPYTDRELKITTETFRDKLIPGKEEEWKLRITGMKGEKVAAELLASMYDASLDAFMDHQWVFDLYHYRGSNGGWNVRNAFSQAASRLVYQRPQGDLTPVIQNYDRLNWFGFDYYGTAVTRLGGKEMMMMKNAMPEMDGKATGQTAEENISDAGQEIPVQEEVKSEPEKIPDMPVRRNFNETAFFYPALMTDENGDVLLKFTMPESLTAWKLMALAHTRDLKTGYLEKEAVTRKELMVMTNAPRFFREGDLIYFTARLVSLSDQKMQGQVQAEFFDAYTMQSLDTLMGNQSNTREFSAEKGSSGVYQWELKIPSGFDAIICRVKATAGDFADGEEVVVPVLPNRMLVTETLPLSINVKGTKYYKFDRLYNSFSSATIKNYRLTLEFTSNPAWYAVQALPYLVENSHESADGVFERYYANTLASWIANSNPRIRQVFESWKNLTPDALLSNLEKNQELKAVLLAETPWVAEARNETERKKRIALLFDLNRMASEQQAALAKLQQLQSPNGGWPWFEGMPDNRYITQLIVTGIGKLQHLGVIELQREPGLISMVQRAFHYLNDRMKEDYEEILKQDRDKLNEDHLGHSQVQFLYAYSFLKDFVKIDPANRDAYEYFRGQASKYWTGQNKYIQGMIAAALNRLEVRGAPVDIINSLKENALVGKDLGMYWREPEGYYWHEAPVERQAMLIEAFSEVTDDQAVVDQMKIWLLKQKQTQDWKTSRATADAVYALLLRGTDLLAGSQHAEVTVAFQKINPLALDGVEVEAGTGYFQKSWTGNEISQQMSNIKIEKKDEGIAWGAIYWQYFENLDKITPAQSPLSLERELYVERNTQSGPVLEPVSDNNILKTGDKVVARIIIRTDRDMEFVHMKDMRSAAFEPVTTLSGYRYQGGLGYYESVRDASVNFYFDYLRKGTYVFEYRLNVTQKGEFSNGISSIQCLYAPEFGAHSQGVRVTVE
jgi:hypothetical protein